METRYHSFGDTWEDEVITRNKSTRQLFASHLPLPSSSCCTPRFLAQPHEHLQAEQSQPRSHTHAHPVHKGCPSRKAFLCKADTLPWVMPYVQIHHFLTASDSRAISISLQRLWVFSPSQPKFQREALFLLSFDSVPLRGESWKKEKYKSIILKVCSFSIAVVSLIF